MDLMLCFFLVLVFRNLSYKSNLRIPETLKLGNSKQIRVTVRGNKNSNFLLFLVFIYCNYT